MRSYRTVIWGTGEVYNAYYNALRYFVSKGSIDICGIVSKDLTGKCRMLDEYSVLIKEQIEWNTIDLVIVMSRRYFTQILQEAKECCGERTEIISYKAMEIPYLDLEKYIRLKNENISIISNNCWGGIVSSTLGLECLSPFKNLFFEDEDFLKVISNLKQYMDSQPEFYRYDMDIHSGKRYPVLRLLDVDIHCNHSKNPDEAVADWNRRRKKINYSNLFYEMYTDEDRIADIFLSVTEQNRRICFFPKKRDNTEKKGMVYVNLANEKKELWEAVNRYAGSGGTRIDLLKLLMGEADFYRRYEG